MNRNGSAILEALIAAGVLSVCAAAVATAHGMAYRAAQTAGRDLQINLLAQELLDEARMRKWDRTSPVGGGAGSQSPLGFDNSDGETATAKAAYNDVDDFNGWIETPPQNPDGTARGDLEGYVRTGAVIYVKDDLSPSPGGQRSDYKKLTVCAQYKTLRSVCLDAVVTNR